MNDDTNMHQFLNVVFEDALRRDLRERIIGTYYPSELPYCIRRNYFLYKVPKQVKLSTLKVFEAGTMYHNRFHELLSKSGLVSSHVSEGNLTFFDGAVTIRGRFDDVIIVETKEEDLKGKFLLETKSVRSLNFISRPKFHHSMQLMFYMNRLHFKEGFLVYIDRRDLRLKVYKVPYNEAIFNEIVGRAIKLNRALLTNTIPEQEAKLKPEIKWQCSYCYYRRECYDAIRKERKSKTKS